MGKKVLVVDDDQSLLKLIESAFKSKGYEVVSLSKGNDAMNYLKDESNVNSLSLLVLDRMLPDIEGVEILKFFYEKYQGKVPVIILSSLSSEKDVMEGLSKGATDYLTKPFNVEVLLQKAEKITR